ncbi:glycoside hydrolase family 28 protein [Phanerochaete carnosa HHB-10118-sp]|uniref:galacturonan 1,4-alpha-galacturonidase n=1 Tax=Phanerochaete carnosa (strain HHB-10118-sp) TaxID=650164 RepID=K5X569_PHACS|nr:glycoside hydrolase family 28 protein [Phanerochaete carnosa HHB-10118-sp]EKM57997.1 glycoside hydrolase family 28 protein [Phanerochaete carnosa HHB-10118-sp]
MLTSVLLLASLCVAAFARLECKVPHLGGGRDDGPAISAAFQRCAKNGKVVLDQYYSVDSLLLITGLDDVEIVLSGTLQYTPDIAKWSPQSLFLTYQNASTAWFLSGNNILLHGGGTLDANGQVWYDAFASSNDAGTAGGSSTTFERPVPLTVGNSTNVVIEDITQLNSPFWNNFVYQSTNVTYRNITINSVSYSSSPASNTDGWDIYRSNNVTITDSRINNDDDCVSFKPNSTNIVFAGETDIVANVTVFNISMNNAQNGARIKVFGGSPDPNSTAGGGSGFVKNVTYSDFQGKPYAIVSADSLVSNVDNPITVDQCYSTPVETCAEFPSTLTISDVHFINVTGTSSGAEQNVVVDIECSAECTDITATGTHIEPPSGSPEFVCVNVTSVNELDFNCTAPPS